MRATVPRAAFLLAALVSLVVLFIPGDDVPAAAPGVDQLVHLVLFAGLAVTGRWAGIRSPVLAGALVGYAALSEVVQALAPLNRSGSAADWAADLAGVAVGLLVWAVAGRRRHGRR